MAKLAGAGALALFALGALPHLLRTPEPPPLANDVGLPQVAPRAEPVPRFLSDRERPKRTTQPRRASRHLDSRFEKDAQRPQGTTGSAAPDVIGSRRRRCRAHSPRVDSPARAPLPLPPEPVPTAPSPSPAPAPAP